MKKFTIALILVITLTGCGGGGTSVSEESFVSGDGAITFIKSTDRKISPTISGMTLSGKNYTYTKDKVAVVNNKSNKEDPRPRGLLLIKIITTKPALETFQEVQKAAMTSIPDLKKFQFSERHIEQSDI
jgi:hypothetical protein